jgi:tetratricopeptide (TPR) repeat protein
LDPDWTFRWKEAPINIDPAKLEALASSFLIGFLEDALRSYPDNPEVLMELGELYTLGGRIEEGLRIDQKLVKILPDHPTVHYNLACSLALMGQGEKAIKALRTALRKGFSDFKLMMEDADLNSLREDPEFQELLDLAKKALP